MDALRTALQPITHNLPTPLHNLGTTLLGPVCYQHLILDLDPHSTACLQLALSKLLGLAIIAASSIVKIPQILKLIRSRSGAGISLVAYVLETAAYLISLAYSVRHGFPFSTFGETALIAAQNVVVCVLVLRYAGRGAVAAALVAGMAVGAYALFDEGVVDGKVLGYLQAGAGVLGVASKGPQIWTVWRRGGTGQLSAFAVFNYLAGSLSRIFTTLQEVDDKLVLYGFVAGFVLNAVLAAQMVYYWNAPKSANHAAELGAGPEKVAMGSSSGATVRSKGPSTRRRG